MKIDGHESVAVWVQDHQSGCSRGALPGWEEDGGGNTTEDMIRQLEAAAEPLLWILERLGCKPSMGTVVH